MTPNGKHLFELLQFTARSAEQYVRAEEAQTKENAPPRHQLFAARKMIKKRIRYVEARIQELADREVSDE
jgi:hypothetical protein